MHSRFGSSMASDLPYAGKRKGMFSRRGKKTQVFAPSGEAMGKRKGDGGASFMETRSMLTLMTGGERKCSVM